MAQIEAQRSGVTRDGSGTRGEVDSPPMVLSFSHFLPLQALLPEKRWLFYPNLAKACGSDPLAARVAALKPDVHVYGHTHFTQDTVSPGSYKLPAGEL